MDQQRIDGFLVACTSTAYSGFTDDKTGEKRPGGQTLRAFVSVAFDQSPLEVKFTGADAGVWESLRAAGQGARFAAMVQLNAKGGGAQKPWIERKFLALLPVAAESNGKPAAAAAGARTS